VSAAERVWEGALGERALEAWGGAIGAARPLGAVLCLQGPLGAGKSTLARAIGRGAGVEAVMPSPTFNLVFAYPLPGGGRLLHFDLYRITSPSEVHDLGWDELGDRGALALVEWPERAAPLLPGDRWDVRLSNDPGAPDRRGVRVHRVGDPPPLPLPGG
jgi:tRNA threonylcarbamoyl adenosine modification protein YjeE